MADQPCQASFELPGFLLMLYLSESVDQWRAFFRGGPGEAVRVRSGQVQFQ